MVYLYSTIKMMHGPINIRFTRGKVYSLTHVAVLPSAKLFCVRKLSGWTGGTSITESVSPFVSNLSSRDGLYTFFHTYVSQVTGIGRIGLNNSRINQSINMCIDFILLSFKIEQPGEFILWNKNWKFYSQHYWHIYIYILFSLSLHIKYITQHFENTLFLSSGEGKNLKRFSCKEEPKDTIHI